MSVDEKTVRHIAKLARIAVSDAEVAALAPELSNILGWIEQLGEVDVTGIEPMTAVIPNTLRLRDDIVTEGDIKAKSSPRAAAEHASSPCQVTNDPLPIWVSPPSATE